MKIAIEGCCHGALDAIYTEIASLEAKHNYKVDLLLICGDFQAIRNERDLQCMSVPEKYRKLGGFHKYYTGEKVAPLPTIIIGGNHEASNYFWELYHGGWIAPNMYFLGHANCIQVNGIRIAGASGIYKQPDFSKGHFERLPYSYGSMRSIYHIREFTIRRLSLLPPRPTIFLSHDWPQSIERHGDLRRLLRNKPFFKEDIDSGRLGSPPLMGLLGTLKPQWWFSAHLHCRFEATVTHPPEIVDSPSAVRTNPEEISIDDDDLDEPSFATAKRTELLAETTSTRVSNNPDEILLDDEEEDVVAPPPPPPPLPKTKFLALDKCLPNRQFLEVIDIETPSDFVPPPNSDPSRPIFSFDPEWLAIVRAFNAFMSTENMQLPYPNEAQAREAVERNLEWVNNNVLTSSASGGKGIKLIEDVQQFVKTAPVPGDPGADGRQQPPYYPNPQTAAFCAMLEIENKVDIQH